jgi:hypothetical protein
MRARPFAWFRWATQVLGVSSTASALYSTFVSADATPDADETPTTLTFTLKDTNDVALAGRSVTYA